MVIYKLNFDLSTDVKLRPLIGYRIMLYISLKRIYSNWMLCCLQKWKQNRKLGEKIISLCQKINNEIESLIIFLWHLKFDIVSECDEITFLLLGLIFPLAFSLFHTYYLLWFQPKIHWTKPRFIGIMEKWRSLWILIALYYTKPISVIITTTTRTVFDVFYILPAEDTINAIKRRECHLQQDGKVGMKGNEWKTERWKQRCNWARWGREKYGNQKSPQPHPP